MYTIYHSHENHNSIKHPSCLTLSKIIWSSCYGLQVGNKSTHLIRKYHGCRVEKELEEVQNQGEEGDGTAGSQSQMLRLPRTFRCRHKSF